MPDQATSSGVTEPSLSSQATKPAPTTQKQSILKKPSTQLESSRFLNNSAFSHANTDDIIPDTDADDDAASRPISPTAIPAICVLIFIILTYIGYIICHLVEYRPFITLQGQTIPYHLPMWLHPDSTSFFWKSLHIIWYLSPLSVHPLQWVTFLFISICFGLSYYRVMAVNPGVVLASDPVWGFHKTLNAAEKHALHIEMFRLNHDIPSHLSTSRAILPPTIERKYNGARRYCRGLDIFKPDRAHMCRATNRLVKRLDHHCTFVYSSVGWNNHKFFILFLFWVIVLGQFMAWKLAYAMSFITDLDGISVICNLLIACIGGASTCALATFLGFHLYLIAIAMTTIEFGERFGLIDPCNGQYKTSPYNVDLLSNFQQVFGHGHIVTWFLPTLPIRAPYEDGTLWLTNVTTPPTSVM